MKSFVMSSLRFCCYDSEDRRGRGDVEITWDPGGGVLTSTVYIGMWSFEGYGMFAILVRNLAIDVGHQSIK